MNNDYIKFKELLRNSTAIYCKWENPTSAYYYIWSKELNKASLIHHFNVTSMVVNEWHNFYEDREDGYVFVLRKGIKPVKEEKQSGIWNWIDNFICKLYQ